MRLYCIQATEEAIINALIAAKKTTGINGNTAPALPYESVRYFTPPTGSFNVKNHPFARQ